MPLSSDWASSSCLVLRRLGDQSTKHSAISSSCILPLIRPIRSDCSRSPTQAEYWAAPTEGRPSHPSADRNSRPTTVSTFRAAPDLPRRSGLRQARADSFVAAFRIAAIDSLPKCQQAPFGVLAPNGPRARQSRQPKALVRTSVRIGCRNQEPSAGSSRCPYQAKWTAADRPRKLCLLCDARPYRGQ